jgi:hypothetical protein
MTTDASPATEEPVAEGTPGAPLSSTRYAQFEADVAKLKAAGGGANPERNGLYLGIGLTILGFVIVTIAWFASRQDTVQQYITRDEIGALIGIAVMLVGIVIWLRNSLTRYLRYWIIRLVYEQREQTDAIVKALRDK